MGFLGGYRREQAGEEEEGKEEEGRGRRCNYVGADHARRVDPYLPRLIFILSSYGALPYESMLVYFEHLAQHIVGVIVLLRSGMPLLVVEPYPSAADRTVPLFLSNLGFALIGFLFLFHYEYVIH